VYRMKSRRLTITLIVYRMKSRRLTLTLMVYIMVTSAMQKLSSALN